MSNSPHQKTELLAPAKNAECGIAAVNCGADAVYIGAPKFGARAAAGNSISEIERLVAYAHKYWAKVYVTLNTILYDAELDEAEKLIHTLYNIGIDAIIIQDMGILEMNLPPVPLIASTQTDNSTWQKVKFLEDTGFHRAILARELTLEQIKEIRAKTTIELEAFIHGSLCVSYSGRCYMSSAFGGRSANRGECAQPCRKKYNLNDSNGNTLIKNKHLLSLRDLNLSEHLEELLHAGITSFKIEGRLKEISYVKNTVAYYRKKLDLILENSDYGKASSGKTMLHFIPDLNKTFNRGYTSYFLHGRGEEITSFDTPKSMGEPIGKILKVFKDFIQIDSEKKLNNGDGICFFPDADEDLYGTKINKVEGHKIYPVSTEHMRQGLQIFRNFDIEFDTQLKNDNSHRKINAVISFDEINTGFKLSVCDADNTNFSLEFPFTKQNAENPQKTIDTIKTQLAKSGDTIFNITEILINFHSIFFIPISALNNARRDLLNGLELKRIKLYSVISKKNIPNNISFPEKDLSFHHNISNQLAQNFYKRHGAEQIEMAFEVNNNLTHPDLMTIKHCLKLSLGKCPKYHVIENKNNIGALYLHGNNQKFKLEFDCNSCELKINL